MPIKECLCDHPYQDAQYGHKRRVCNETVTATGAGHRCTVCGKDVVKASVPKKKAKKPEPLTKKGR